MSTQIEADLALLRLLQLVSPGLPIGMYSYSQGMEKAVEEGWLSGEAAVAQWLGGLLDRCIARTDLPVLARLYEAWSAADDTGVRYWSRLLLSCREADELRQEDRFTGQALAKVLHGLNIDEAAIWLRDRDATLATSFALAGVRWRVSRQTLLAGYAWSWLENQVLCAVKLVPLGQAAGQRLLAELAEAIPVVVATALQLGDDDIGGSSPMLALVSSRHETQYSRLFRS